MTDEFHQYMINAMGRLEVAVDQLIAQRDKAVEERNAALDLIAMKDATIAALKLKIEGKESNG